HTSVIDRAPRTLSRKRRNQRALARSRNRHPSRKNARASGLRPQPPRSRRFLGRKERARRDAGLFSFARTGTGYFLAGLAAAPAPAFEAFIGFFEATCCSCVMRRPFCGACFDG